MKILTGILTTLPEIQIPTGILIHHNNTHLVCSSQQELLTNLFCLISIFTLNKRLNEAMSKIFQKYVFTSLLISLKEAAVI